MRLPTNVPMRVSVGVNTSCARRHTSPGLTMSHTRNESVKRVNASRMLWKLRPSAAACCSAQAPRRAITP